MILKGWAVARYHPDPAARGYCDIDLAVPPAEVPAAQQVLAGLDVPPGLVDLHAGIPDLPRRDWTSAFARSQRVPLGDALVRVLCPEDQLRLLTIHFVRHSCRRALSLCDIAVMLELHGPDMDWDRCLRGSHGLRRWILAVAGLASVFLGTRLPAAIADRPGIQPPSWLKNMTLWQWGGGNIEEPWWSLGTFRDWASRVAYRRFWNPAVWSQRLGLPPVRLLPALWAAALFGRTIQPLARVSRGLARCATQIQPSRFTKRGVSDISRLCGSHVFTTTYTFTRQTVNKRVKHPSGRFPRFLRQLVSLLKSC